eukprot:scaffold9123_cov186-Alexandrium_tamarense.AAC.1
MHCGHNTTTSTLHTSLTSPPTSMFRCPARVYVSSSHSRTLTFVNPIHEHYLQYRCVGCGSSLLLIPEYDSASSFAARRKYQRDKEIIMTENRVERRRRWHDCRRRQLGQTEWATWLGLLNFSCEA